MGVARSRPRSGALYTVKDLCEEIDSYPLQIRALIGLIEGRGGRVPYLEVAGRKVYERGAIKMLREEKARYDRRTRIVKKAAEAANA